MIDWIMALFVIYIWCLLGASFFFIFHKRMEERHDAYELNLFLNILLFFVSGPVIWVLGLIIVYRGVRSRNDKTECNIRPRRNINKFI